MFDQMAKRPMSKIVKQRRDDHQGSVRIAEEHGLFWVVGKLLKHIDGIAVNAQRVLKARVGCSRVDQRNEAELRHAGESSKRGRIDQSADPRCYRNVDFRADANHRRGRLQFRNHRRTGARN